MTSYDILTKNYLETWQIQKPLMNKILTLNELNSYLLKERKNLLTFFSQNKNILGIQLANNVFAANDLGYGGICEKCGSDLVVFFTNEDLCNNKDSYDYDYAIWLPSLESHTILRSNTVEGHVFPIFADRLSTQKIYYASLCCDIPHEESSGPQQSLKAISWKHLTYEMPYGLFYSNKSVEF